ncbi:hypothetical protein EON63_11735 [archaeon]|nr:MAG: hypothetical protein EON63_11735 [archaeon]
MCVVYGLQHVYDPIIAQGIQGRRGGAKHFLLFMVYRVWCMGMEYVMGYAMMYETWCWMCQWCICAVRRMVSERCLMGLIMRMRK